MSASNSHAKKLDGVQFGRAIAAMLVVFAHEGHMLSLPQYNGATSSEQAIFHFGNSGVDFFFVLSGFVIFYVHQADIGRPARLGHYVWRRISRIYPMYWVATALVIATLILKRDWTELAPLHFFKSLILYPEYEYPILGVGWTLTHEVLFYLAFAVAITSRRAGYLIGLGWLALVTYGLFRPIGPALLHFASDPYHFEFAFGIMAAIAAGRLRSPRAAWAIPLGVALFAYACLLLNREQLLIADLASRFMLGIASAFILYGIAVSESLELVRFPKWAAYLGATSYSLYLLHPQLVGLTARALFHLPAAHAHPHLSFLIVFLVTIGIACAAYQWVETPLQRAIRNLRAPRLKEAAAKQA